jgi:NifU-like protein involved in Fe-S cluster formation
MTELYTTEILRWATRIPHSSRLESPGVSVTKTSRVCGSRLSLDVCFAEGKIVDFGQEVKACALGQAAAAIVGKNIIGLTKAEFVEIEQRFRQMVKTGEADFTGKWSDLSLLSPVYDHPGRHGSVLLPFDCLNAVFQGVADDIGG